MIPQLTKLAARSFAILLLVAGVATGVHIGYTGKDTAPTGPASGELAQDDLDDSHVQQRTARDWHERYVKDAANEDASEKAENIAEVASDQAKKLDNAYEAVKEKEKKEKEEAEKPDVGPIPSDCKEYDDNKAVGCKRLLDEGFELDQMPCLEKLWDKESGWNEKANNPGSGAYGIPQALPGSKMASKGDDWKTNPDTQVAWGLDYIKGKYDDPCGAWEYSEANGSY